MKDLKFGNDLKKFAKDINKFSKDSVEDFKLEGAQILADQLRALLRSGRASTSASKLNKLFKARNHLDDDGNIMVVANPADIADKIVVVDNIIMMALTEDEDRWIRADSVFGDNILAELNIKYRSE